MWQRHPQFQFKHFFIQKGKGQTKLAESSNKPFNHEKERITKILKKSELNSISSFEINYK